MKKLLMGMAVLVTVAVAGVCYGIAIHKYKVFPYGIAKTAHEHLLQNGLQDDTHGPWSIGVYEGESPFNLVPAADVTNPVLSARDVTDTEARFVADPFLVPQDGRYFLFFEVLNKKNNQGDIAYSESSDGKHWNYRKIILDEKFHLSYPYVFEWNGDHYLVPESFEDLSVRLYKATNFPEKWEHVGTLLSGYRYVDPSIFRYHDRWWLLVSTIENDVLNLYYSDDLSGEWRPHPMNPIIRFDRNIARPGGRVISIDNRLYRFAQDDDPEYGTQVFAFEIVELTEKTYVEKPVSDMPLLSGTGSGWNAAGMHHVDLHRVGDKWMATVDGRDR